MIEKQLISHQLSLLLFKNPIKTDSLIYKKISSFLQDKQYHIMIKHIEQCKHLCGLPNDFTYLDSDNNSHTYKKVKTNQKNKKYIYIEMPEHILQKQRENSLDWLFFKHVHYVLNKL